MKTIRLILGTLTITADVAIQANAQFTFRTNNGTITITGYTGSGGNVVIPNATNGYPVTGIAQGAFISNNSYLTGISIPSSINQIGSYALAYCPNLTTISVDTNNPNFSSVDGVLFNKSGNTLVQCPGGKAGSYTVPNNVTVILGYAFAGCDSLTNVTIPNSVTYIGSYAFFESTIPTLALPDSVTSIRDYTFANCTSLTNITISNGVMSIGTNAFADCLSLAQITIPARVTNIASGAFYYCTNLGAITVSATNFVYSSLGGVLLNKNQTTLILYPLGKVGSGYTIPDSVISIGNNSFMFCTSLSSIIIPDSVTTIGNSAFYECTSLTNVTIGSGVVSIENEAF